jgi:hypothetical protein
LTLFGFSVLAAEPKDLAVEIENALNTGLKLWYPASVDPRCGFHLTFSSDWKLDPYSTIRTRPASPNDLDCRRSCPLPS